MFLRGQKSLTQRRAQYYNVVDTNTDGGRGAVIRQVWFLEGFTMSIQNEYLSGLSAWSGGIRQSRNFTRRSRRF